MHLKPSQRAQRVGFKGRLGRMRAGAISVPIRGCNPLGKSSPKPMRGGCAPWSLLSLGTLRRWQQQLALGRAGSWHFGDVWEKQGNNKGEAFGCCFTQSILSPWRSQGNRERKGAQRVTPRGLSIVRRIRNHPSCSSSLAEVSFPPPLSPRSLAWPRAPLIHHGHIRSRFTQMPPSSPFPPGRLGAGLFAFTGKPVNKGHRRDCSFPGCRNRWRGEGGAINAWGDSCRGGGHPGGTGRWAMPL